MTTHNKQGVQQRLVLACVSAIVLGTGCVGEDGSFGEGEDDVETISSAVTVYPSSLSSKRQYGAMWTWANNGVNVVPLASSASSACFINSVWGSLKGNDWVGIVDVGGYWVLKGTGASSSPAADAYCILDLPSNISITPEVTANDSTGTVRLPGTVRDQHTCFITKVKGDWTSGTNAVDVDMKTDGSWWLTARGAEASARCVRRPPLPIETFWSGSGSLFLYGDLTDPNNNRAINSTTRTSYFCSLTRMSGILNNIDGWVGTYNEPLSAGGWQWYVGGKKNGIAPYVTYPLAGAARCLK